MCGICVSPGLESGAILGRGVAGREPDHPFGGRLPYAFPSR